MYTLPQISLNCFTVKQTDSSLREKEKSFYSWSLFFD